MIDVELCPFCGYVQTGYGSTVITGRGRYRQWMCTHCGATGPMVSIADHEEKAIKLWNRRAERTCEYNECNPHEAPEDCEIDWEYKGRRLVDDGSLKYCPGCGAKIEKGGASS